MRNLTATEKERSPIFEQITIVILLILIALVVVLSAYKYVNKEPAVTPQEMELKTLIEQVNAYPDNIQYRLALAFSYQKIMDFTNAEQHYNEVLKQDPKELRALYNLGVINKEQQKYQEAEEFFKQVLDIKNTHVLGSLGLGEVYLNQGNHDEAIKVIDNIIKDQGYLVEPRLLKASALEKKGDKAGAIQEYKQVLKYVPNQEEALAGLKRLQ